jgi:hypothetical protein
VSTEITIVVEEKNKSVKAILQGISSPFEITVSGSLEETLIRKLTKQLNTELHQTPNQKEGINLEFSFDKKDSSSYFTSWDLPKNG